MSEAREVAVLFRVERVCVHWTDLPLQLRVMSWATQDNRLEQGNQSETPKSRRQGVGFTK